MVRCHACKKIHGMHGSFFWEWEFHDIPWNFVTSQVPWNFIISWNAIERVSWEWGFHDEFGVGARFHELPWIFYTRCNDYTKLHVPGIWCWRKVPRSTYLPRDLEKFHEVPLNCAILESIISLKEGSVFCLLLYDYICLAGNSLVVEVLRYHSSIPTFGCPWFRLNGDITF